MSTYVYAITRADHPLRVTDVPGVGRPPATVRTVATDALCAVVSDPPADLRAKRRDLAAHQGVLERLMADGSVLPMRFGMVAEDDAQVLATLEENRAAYLDRLGQVDGCLEYHLTVARDEDDLLREIVAESPDVRRLNEATREQPEAYGDKVALGELLAREVQARQARDASTMVTRLSAPAVRHVLTEPAESHLLKASFLVRRDDAAAFAQAVDEEAERRGDAYTLTLHGPLPPYSFV